MIIKKRRNLYYTERVSRKCDLAVASSGHKQYNITIIIILKIHTVYNMIHTGHRWYTEGIPDVGHCP